MHRHHSFNQTLVRATVLLLLGVAGGYLATGTPEGRTPVSADSEKPIVPPQRSSLPVSRVSSKPLPPPPSPEEIGQTLERALRAEARDPDWSEATEQQIARVFHASSIQGTTLTRAFCGTTMCQVVMSHENETTREDFLEFIPELPPFNTSGLMYETPVPDVPVTTTLIFAREGHELAA